MERVEFLLLLRSQFSGRRDKHLAADIGWLARENEIVITPERRSFRIQLNDARVKEATN
jgi:Winged helix-turn-helix domain (DUF2582)